MKLKLISNDGTVKMVEDVQCVVTISDTDEPFVFTHQPNPQNKAVLQILRGDPGFDKFVEMFGLKLKTQSPTKVKDL